MKAETDSAASERCAHVGAAVVEDRPHHVDEELVHAARIIIARLRTQLARGVICRGVIDGGAAALEDGLDVGADFSQRAVGKRDEVAEQLRRAWEASLLAAVQVVHVLEEAPHAWVGMDHTGKDGDDDVDAVNLHLESWRREIWGGRCILGFARLSHERRRQHL